MMDKKVTVIVPCYNSAKYLPKLLDSLKNQTIGIENLLCVFVDDASDDAGRTMDVIESFHSEFPDSVKTIRLEENMRQGGARNAGMRYIESEWVQFVDADDWLERDALERLYQVAVNYDVDMIQYNARNGLDTKDEERNRIDRLVDIETAQDRKDFLMAGIFNTSHNAKLYRRQIIQSSGARFAEKKIYEEPLFVYPQFFYVRRVALLDEDFYCRLYHGDNATFTMNKEMQIQHSQVQYELLTFLKDHPWVTAAYRNEIGYYFLWTYFFETVINAGRTGTTVLTKTYFEKMQQICRSEFPDWRENPYVIELAKPLAGVFDGIDTIFEDQEQIDEFCRTAAVGVNGLVK